MKKTLFTALFLAAAVLFSAVPASASDFATVFVTIADGEGRLALNYDAIEVTDVDGDGALTMSDALHAAHEQKYPGGAEGCVTAATEFGISLFKLWGYENGTAYGYYLNNSPAMSLLDAVKEGDHVSAFAYTDLDGWSDTFCFFDENSVRLTAGSETELPLTLSAAGYDENWNSITVPVQGAIITVNGVRTSAVTDAEGKASVMLTPSSGADYVISAVSDTAVLVPPVLIVSGDAETAPQTGDVAIPAAALMFAALIILLCQCVKRRRVKADAK